MGDGNAAGTQKTENYMKTETTTGLKTIFQEVFRAGAPIDGMLWGEPSSLPAGTQVVVISRNSIFLLVKAIVGGREYHAFLDPDYIRMDKAVKTVGDAIRAYTAVNPGATQTFPSPYWRLVQTADWRKQWFFVPGRGKPAQYFPRKADAAKALVAIAKDEYRTASMAGTEQEKRDASAALAQAMASAKGGAK